MRLCSEMFIQSSHYSEAQPEHAEAKHCLSMQKQNIDLCKLH